MDTKTYLEARELVKEKNELKKELELVKLNDIHVQIDSTYLSITNRLFKGNELKDICIVKIENRIKQIDKRFKDL